MAASTFLAKVALGTAGTGLGAYAVWQGMIRQHWSQRGECVVDIVGADLQIRSNNKMDYFSKPDVQVTCWHGQTKRSTQTEHNAYEPRFLFRTKMPFYYNEGFAFTVLDVDRINGSEVIGRCYVDPQTAQKVMKDQTPLLLSLGDGIGLLKVRIHKTNESTTDSSLDQL